MCSVTNVLLVNLWVKCLLVSVISDRYIYYQMILAVCKIYINKIYTQRFQ